MGGNDNRGEVTDFTLVLGKPGYRVVDRFVEPAVKGEVPRTEETAAGFDHIHEGDDGWGAIGRRSLGDRNWRCR